MNHGPLACEALFARGLEDEVMDWANRSARPARDTPVRTTSGSVVKGWQDELGHLSMLEEWVTHFEISIDDAGWRDTVATWVPRLMPSIAAKLFHPLIRTAHATRAIEELDTGPRLRELAFALGYWTARYSREGSPAAHEVTTSEAAAIFPLSASLAASLHLESAHRALFGYEPEAGGLGSNPLEPLALEPLALEPLALEPTKSGPVKVDRTALSLAAAATGDVHAVKLTEAALRGLDATREPVFALAARTVAGLP